MSGLTGFIASNGLDLSYIFQPYSSGTNPTTNYITNMNGPAQDLSNIFQPLSEYTPYTVTNNDASIDITNDISNNLYNISIGKHYTSGTVTIQFLQPITATVMLVGGGGGCVSTGAFSQSFGGGGGGETLFFSYNFIVDVSYSFFLGSGAHGNPSSTTLTTSGSVVHTANNGQESLIIHVGGNGGGITGGNGGDVGISGTYTVISPNVYSIGGGGGSIIKGGGCSGYDYVVKNKTLPFPLTANDISGDISVGGNDNPNEGGQQGGGSQGINGIIGGGGGINNANSSAKNGGYGWCLITCIVPASPQAPITNYKISTGEDLNQIFSLL